MISLLECDNGDLERSLTGLAPYLRGLLDNGVRRALWMHAEQVHLEHVLGATVGDEDSAAGQVIEHAFADPETIDMELLALSPGLMVVGAKAVLPFSLGALAALREARTRALGEDQEQLGCADLARARGHDFDKMRNSVLMFWERIQHLNARAVREAGEQVWAC